MGPLIGAVHLERVDGFVRRAKADGATVALGGEPHHELNAQTGGFYYRPTLFTDVDPAMEIVRHEVFGPVLTLQTFGSEEEGIAMANATDYGLAATVVTSDPARAERVSAQLSRAPSGSTASSSATCPRPSGATAAPASAARAGRGRSTSTAT